MWVGGFCAGWVLHDRRYREARSPKSHRPPQSTHNTHTPASSLSSPFPSVSFPSLSLHLQYTLTPVPTHLRARGGKGVGEVGGRLLDQLGVPSHEPLHPLLLGNGNNGCKTTRVSLGVFVRSWVGARRSTIGDWASTTPPTNQTPKDQPEANHHAPAARRGRAAW